MKRWPASCLLERLHLAIKGDEPVTPELLEQGIQAFEEAPIVWGSLMADLALLWLEPTPDQATTAILLLEQLKDDLEHEARRRGWNPYVIDRTSPSLAPIVDVIDALDHYNEILRKAA